MKKNILIFLIFIVGGFVLFLLVDTLGVPIYVVVIIVFILSIVFILLNANKFASKAYENRFQRLKECEKCKKIIPEEATICPFCKEGLENE